MLVLVNGGALGIEDLVALDGALGRWLAAALASYLRLALLAFALRLAHRSARSV